MLFTLIGKENFHFLFFVFLVFVPVFVSFGCSSLYVLIYFCIPDCMWLTSLVLPVVLGVLEVVVVAEIVELAMLKMYACVLTVLTVVCCLLVPVSIGDLELGVVYAQVLVR